MSFGTLVSTSNALNYPVEDVTISSEKANLLFTLDFGEEGRAYLKSRM